MMRCPKDFPDSSVGKESTCKTGDPSSITWVGKICWRKDRLPFPVFLGFPGDSAGKESACSAEDLGLIPGLGRSPGEGKGSVQLSSVQLLSCVWLFVTPWTAALQASLSITNSQSLLKLMSIESVMPSNHLILCDPLLLPPSLFPSIRVFSNESVLCIRWPKYWSFSFSISPSNEHPGLIFFRMDWLDLLAAQGTLKSLFQHHSSKASILGAQLSLESHSHIHTWPLGKP